MKRLRGVACLAVALGVSACSRRLPNADECQRLSLKLHGVPLRLRSALPPAYRRSVDAQTRECFTLPYDRELVRCLDRGLDDVPFPAPAGISPKDVVDAEKSHRAQCFLALKQRR